MIEQCIMKFNNASKFFLLMAFIVCCWLTGCHSATANTNLWFPVPTVPGTPPSARFGYSIAADNSLASVYIYGGVDEAQNRLNDMWSYDMVWNKWIQVFYTTTAPVRVNAASVYTFIEKPDSIEQRFYLFGGADESFVYRNEVYELNIQTGEWKLLEVAGPTPVPRTEPSIVQKNEDVFYIIGGVTIERDLNDIWEFTISTKQWRNISADDDSPSFPKGRFNLCASLFQNKLIIGGGLGGGGERFKDFWYFDLDAGKWFLLNVTKPKEVVSCTNIDSDLYALSRTGLFTANIGQLTSSSVLAWEPVVEPIQNYSQRTNARLVSVFDRMFWFGGHEISETDIVNPLNDAYIYDPSNDELIHLPELVVPPAVRFHTAVQIASKMIVYGGITHKNELSNSLAVLDLISERWIYPDITGEAPPARSKHSAIVKGNNMIIYGGISVGGVVLTDVWSFSLDLLSWTRIEQLPDLEFGSPLARYKHAAVSNSSHIIVHGGISSTGKHLDDTWMLHLQSFRWKRLDIPNTPSWFECKAALVDNATVMFAGCIDEKETPIAGSAFLDLSSNSWSTVVYTGANIRAPVQDLSLVSTGTNQAVSFGGDIATITFFSQFLKYNKGVVTEVPVANIFPSRNAPSQRSAHSSTFFQNKFILYGGAAPVLGFVRSGLPENTYSDAWKFSFPLCKIRNDTPCVSCSPGSSLENEECVPCPIGQYSSTFDRERCMPCPAGTYGVFVGTQSIDQCIPCGFGFYNDEEGQTSCKKCTDPGTICPIGAIIPLNSSLYSATAAISIYKDPRAEQNDTDNTLKIIKYIIVGSGFALAIVLTVVLSVLLTCLRCFGVNIARMSWLDCCFSMAHDVNEGESSIKRTSIIGAVATVLLFELSLVLIFWSLFDYFALNRIYIDNLEQKEAFLPPGVYKFNVTLYGLSDCSAESAELTTTGVSGFQVQYINNNQLRACSAVWTCDTRNCRIRRSTFSILLAFSGRTALYFAMDYRVQVPYLRGKTFEFIGTRISSASGLVFRGAAPTEVNLQLNPVELKQLVSRFLAYIGVTSDRTYHGLTVQESGVTEGTSTSKVSVIDGNSAKVIIRVSPSTSTLIIRQRTVQTPLNLVAQIFSLITTVLAILTICFPYFEIWVQKTNNCCNSRQGVPRKDSAVTTQP